MNKSIFFTFGGFICKIIGPTKQINYIFKCYSKSPFAELISELIEKNETVNATLKIKVLPKQLFRDELSLFSKSKNLEFTLQCTEDLFMLFPVIEQVLRKIFYILFFKNNGFILHASAMQTSKGAIAFTGPSGSGKSTIASLLKQSSDFQIFSDNNLFVLRINNDFAVFKSPFLEWGVNYETKLKKNDFKLKFFRLFVLKKYKKNLLKKNTFNQSVITIARQIQIPISSLSKDEEIAARKNVFQFLKQYENKIYELSFIKDKKIINFLKRNSMMN